MAKAFGLDIGTQNIRLVELSGKEDKFVVEAYGSTRIPTGHAVDESDNNKGEMVKAVKNLVKDARVKGKNVSLSLPETQSFTQVIKLPLISDSELKKSMRWQAEQYIPLPLDQVSFDYEIIDRDQKKNSMVAVVSAAPINIIEKYTKFAVSAGLEISVIETQILSTIRSISRLVPENINAAIINLGYNSSDFAFVTREKVLFTNTVPTGGAILTRAISQELDFSQEQAERYKMTYGVDSNQLEGKVYAAIAPILDNFLKQINKGFVYFKEQYSDKQVGLILVCGGGALMPGIVRYMAEFFGIETQRAEPFAGMSYKKGLTPLSHSSTEYTAAAGLAMRYK